MKDLAWTYDGLLMDDGWVGGWLDGWMDDGCAVSLFLVIDHELWADDFRSKKRKKLVGDSFRDWLVVEPEVPTGAKDTGLAFVMGRQTLDPFMVAQNLAVSTKRTKAKSITDHSIDKLTTDSCLRQPPQFFYRKLWFAESLWASPD